MDIGKPGPPPMAEGAYWFLAPAAVVFATLPLTLWFAGMADRTFVPVFAAAFDMCRMPFVAVTRASHEWLMRAVHLLPRNLVDALPLVPDVSSNALLFSFAGGAYAASWIGAGLQRAWGPVGGAVAAILLTLILGGTLAGVWILAIAYFAAVGSLFFALEAVLPLLFDGDNENDGAVAVPLVAAPTFAVVIVAASALF